MMYAARTVDMFVSVRAVTLKSIISSCVDGAELGNGAIAHRCDARTKSGLSSQKKTGRIFSIIGIIEAFGKFVFVSTYSLIYKNTLETWPSAFYVASFLCLALTTVLFLYVFMPKTSDY